MPSTSRRKKMAATITATVGNDMIRTAAALTAGVELKRIRLYRYTGSVNSCPIKKNARRNSPREIVKQNRPAARIKESLQKSKR